MFLHVFGKIFSTGEDGTTLSTSLRTVVICVDYLVSIEICSADESSGANVACEWLCINMRIVMGLILYVSRSSIGRKILLAKRTYKVLLAHWNVFIKAFLRMEALATVWTVLLLRFKGILPFLAVLLGNLRAIS